MHNFKEFIDYVFSFYGEGGIYPENHRTREQIALATLHYLDDCNEDITWVMAIHLIVRESEIT